MNIHGLHPVYAGTGHCVELIVEQEMPTVFAAFRMSGLTISHVNVLFVCFVYRRERLTVIFSLLDGRTLDKTMFLVYIRLA